MKTLGDKIRYFRNLKGWSQDDMADKLEISLPAYSKIERNITDVSISRLTQIAKVFGITVIDLLSVSTKPSEQSDLQKLLREKDKEINKLQKKVIELLEKLGEKK
jgi:transcriptional regulator with XRE-family HTH domain